MELNGHVVAVEKRRILVTGAAGFIGYHVCQALVGRGDQVIGFDNMNAYYDVRLKEARLERLIAHKAFTFERGDIADTKKVEAIFSRYLPTHVINLAAQAGVRHSLKDPHTYVSANLAGFVNIQEACRHHPVEHLVYASTSSVYGANTCMPFSVTQAADHPLSLYAATKRSNELLAHSYSHLFNINTTGLRFFTVYGPWGRPDMAMFLFARAILAGEPVQLFNHGKMRRDFTYIDDIVAGTLIVLDQPATPDPEWSGQTPASASSTAPWRIHNIGNNRPTEITQVVDLLELYLGRKAIRELVAIQPGDVHATLADISTLTEVSGFKPKTTIETGVRHFVDWYLDYHRTA